MNPSDRHSPTSRFDSAKLVSRGSHGLPPPIGRKAQDSHRMLSLNMPATKRPLAASPRPDLTARN